MDRSTGLVAALLVSGFVVAAEDAYFIQYTILDGDRVVGSPAVVAETGKQVTVSVTDTYDLALTAEKQDSGRVLLSTDITIAGKTHSPELLLEMDRPAEIRIGDAVLRVTVSKFSDDV